MISSKLPGVGTTIFTIMSKMASEHKAINLSQGYPDFECSPALIDRVEKHMRAGHNQYAPMQGLPALRQAIARKTEKMYTAKYDPESEITVTAGATQAIYTAITAVVKEGDEVIVFEPAYDTYVPVIKLNGGVPIFVQMKPPHFSIDWDAVQKHVTGRTRMIIINSPHNPTGAILTAQDMGRLEKLTAGTNIIVLSDEVYEHILFDGLEHQSVARYPKLAERSFVVSSFGKTYHTTGWKMGYCLAPEKLMAEFRKIHQFLVFAVNTPLQHAFAEELDENEGGYRALPDFYQEKRDYFLDQLKGTRFRIDPTRGTYFQLLEYSSISKEKDRGLAERLTREIGVASIPISEFYHEAIKHTYLRFCFAKQKETLKKAADKLKKL